jgi:hypothetical protein
MSTKLPIYIFYPKDIIAALRCELVAQGFPDIPPADKCSIKIQSARRGQPLRILLLEK